MSSDARQWLPLILSLAAGCTTLAGSDYEDVLATLRGSYTSTGVIPQNGRVAALWFQESGKIAQTLHARDGVFGAFEIDLDDFPPDAAMNQLGMARVALGRLLFFDDRDGDGVASVADLAVAVPEQLSLLYVEGQTAEAPSSIFSGAPRGYSLAARHYAPPPACVGADCCKTYYAPESMATPLLVPLVEDPSLARYLCDDTQGAPLALPSTCSTQMLPCPDCGAIPVVAIGDRMTCSDDRRAYLIEQCHALACGGVESCDARAILLPATAAIPSGWPCL